MFQMGMVPLRAAGGAFVRICWEENTNDTSRHGRLQVRADTRLSQIASGTIIWNDQQGGNRCAGPRLRIPAQGSPGGGIRPRGKLPWRLGQWRGQGPAWS